MARPGKAVLDVTIMAGWAFAAVLTGLVALTMVEQSSENSGDATVLAARDADARIVTGSVPPVDLSGSDKGDAELIASQNQTFDPFVKHSQKQDVLIQDLATQLRALKQEVAAFHSTTRSLRTENDRLRQRLAKVELSNKEQNSSVRVVELPKRNDSRNPIVASNPAKPLRIDSEATGSIAPVAPLPTTGQTFDPFSGNLQTKVITRVEPLSMDVAVGDTSQPKMLPRIKPNPVLSSDTAVLRPKSEVIPAPKQASGASQTRFAIDLGSFISLSDLRSAWQEISISQRNVVGDLTPLSRIAQGSGDRLAVDLVAGPIQNAAQAASVCARLKIVGYKCSVSIYQGQAVALR